jgi:WD40 repeat protein
MSDKAQQQPNCMKTFRGHDGAVSAVAFSSDSSRLFSCGRDGTVRLWDIAAGCFHKMLLFVRAVAVAAACNNF